MSENTLHISDGFYYFYSAVAQVVATLLGLVLAGYALYKNHLQAIVEKDDSYSEVVEDLLLTQSKSFRFFMISSLILLVLSLGILRNEEDFAAMSNSVKTIEICFLIFLCWQIYRLIDTMVNPHAISAWAEAMLTRLDPSESTVHLEDFMILYSKLEASIEDHFAKHFPNLSADKNYSTARKVRQLVYLEPDIEVIYSHLKELIKLRNLYFHSMTAEVPISTYNDLKSVVSKLKIEAHTDDNNAEQ